MHHPVVLNVFMLFWDKSEVDGAHTVGLYRNIQGFKG
jgi:hypothetical protein